MKQKQSWVVYPGVGVFQMVGKENVGDTELVRLVNNRGAKILIPTDKAEVVIRPISNQHDLNAAFKIIQAPVVSRLPPRNKVELLLAQKYKGGSIFEMAELVGLLLRIKFHRKLSVKEREYLDLCMNQIAEEASLTSGVDKYDVLKKMTECVYRC